MKLMINIPDEAYELLKSKSELDNIAESIIANGTPISTEGDLISREDLKEAIRKRLCISSLKYLTEQEKVIVEEIDNAPTVEPDISEIEEKFWHRCGFLQGYTTGLKDKERPQGEWVRKEDIIHYIATQYSEHNELVPIWLSIGDLKGGAE